MVKSYPLLRNEANYVEGYQARGRGTELWNTKQWRGTTGSPQLPPLRGKGGGVGRRAGIAFSVGSAL